MVIEEEFKFYIRFYPVVRWDDEQGAAVTVSPASSQIDVMEEYDCGYAKMQGISENGKAKNIYTESYAESDELRIYLPDELAYENTKCVLTLLFPATGSDRMDVQSNERRFFEAVSGKKIEWYDTFRKRYVTLILIEAPKLTGEKLYGGSRYRQVEYTFQNVYGRSFATSKIG